MLYKYMILLATLGMIYNAQGMEETKALSDISSHACNRCGNDCSKRWIKYNQRYYCSGSCRRKKYPQHQNNSYESSSRYHSYNGPCIAESKEEIE